MRILIFVIGAALSAALLPAQDADTGRLTFESRCARCHGADAAGGDMGPNIRYRLASNSDAQLAKLFHDGSGAMPPIPVTDSEIPALTRFLRSLEQRRRPVERITARTVDGKVLNGEFLNQGFDDLQIAHRRWPRAPVAPRRRPLSAKPARRRLARLQRRPRRQSLHHALPRSPRPTSRAWRPSGSSPCPTLACCRCTPVVVGGIMYVSAANECYALDAGTGRPIWHYRRPRTRGATGRHQSRSGGSRRPRLHGDRQRPHDRPEPLHRRSWSGIPRWPTGI